MTFPASILFPFQQLHLSLSHSFLSSTTHQRPLQLLHYLHLPSSNPNPKIPNSFPPSAKSQAGFRLIRRPQLMRTLPPSLLLLLLSLLPLSLSQPPRPRGVLIDCGATVSSTINNRTWLPDSDYISSGTPRQLTTPNLAPTLSTLRSFPLLNNLGRKFCYVVPVYRNATYLICTTYYYGGVNSGAVSPPVFDQIVDGTVWSVVNTTEDYARGNASYYEGVFLAAGKSMSVCVAPNSYTESDPFILGLEFVLLGESLYNSTNFVWSRDIVLDTVVQL